MRKPIKFSAVAIFVLVLCTATACSVLNPQAAATTEPAAASPTPVPARVVAEGHLVPAQNVALGFLNGGEVQDLLVAKGDKVSKDQALANTSGSEQAQAVLKSAQAEALSAQQALNDLNNHAASAKAQAQQAVYQAEKDLYAAQTGLDNIDTDNYQTQVDNANQKVQDRKDDLNDAQDEVDQTSDLSPDSDKRKNAEDKLTSAQKDYDRAVRDYNILVNSKDMAGGLVDVAQAHLDDARNDLSNVQNGPDKDQLALAQARLDQANAQVSAAQTAIDQLTIKAPFTGTVADVIPEAGEIVSPGAPVVVLMDDSTWYVDSSDLTENQVVDLAVGDEVQVSFDALPGVQYSGTVEEISRVASQHLGDVTYTVHVRLPEIDPSLRWGMTATVKLP
jgi:HlyD family secretion protein